MHLWSAGGMFEFVSGANYFGESLEWTGFAVACWNFPALSFAIFVILFLGSRALQYHRWAHWCAQGHGLPYDQS